ncbi:hypothetical protein [Terribacillus saccharophilus]|uniref:DUF3885 domain-containing protein n=1 Tax=Terribacillus saccharophilus TaxID=361277 RepID=A0A268A6L2_9BACI|nr:hypothetical protein [Terribacillus saccharophilus]PAD19765.1 hypothetical protein CHH64_17110 [Terribacillus saccharophilus]PAF16520.1 hypothetical protein CHH51_17210 [Terribacillus saccharophilus]PAF20210.1 hypothetical protein CHH49_17630 [Terribacillus saccharophilus]PAF35221.1 hypothetical protein CHH58_17250 [Terribacillus saccharophilus]PAF36162.1 hypothetical protein CHH69_11460 [Terribacillus saccharophilus]
MHFSITQLDLFDSDSTIYFQAPASHRLRIATSHFEDHSNLPILRDFVHSIFSVNTHISMTGFIGYYIGSKRIWDRQYLKNSIKLSNWTETYVHDEEGGRYIYMTVKNITTENVNALCKQTAQGRKCSSLMFYTEDRVFQISADVFDLVMTDERQLSNLCTKFYPWIDTYYPNIKTM